MTATLPPPLPSRSGRRSRQRVWLILSGTLGTTLATALCAGWLFLHWLTNPAPTPDQLRETLRAHRGEFERLVTMMGEENAIVGVHSGWVEVRDQPRQLSDGGQDQRRLREY